MATPRRPRGSRCSPGTRPATCKKVLYSSLGGENRGYIAATINYGGSDVRVFNTHIDNGHQLVADQIGGLSQVARAAPRALVMGDFNVNSADARMNPMWDNGFVDIDPNCYRAQPDSCLRTFSEPNPTSKIDDILLKGYVANAPPEVHPTAVSRTTGR